MTFSLLLDEIKVNISKILSELKMSDVNYTVEPARPGFGDVTCNVSFLLSKHLKKTPLEIAKIISGKYSKDLGKYVSVVNAHPSGYLNFEANMKILNKIIIEDSIKENYGCVDIGHTSRVIVEHTSVNPNKALHIGHVRNIVIGDTVSRILRKANYDVAVLNYIDDSGLQVADIVLGFKKLGFSTEPPGNTKFDHYCGDKVYVKTTQEYDKHPELKNVRNDILRDIEEGTSDTAKFADSVTKRVLQAQLQTCWNLSVTYDCLNYESQIVRSGLWSDIFEKLKDMNLIEFEKDGDNAGCWVIRGDKEKDKVIVRSNGTATYIAKDIPYAAWKLSLVDDPFYYEQYKNAEFNTRHLWSTTLQDTGIKKDFTGDKVITVIDSRQSNLQKIITSIMGKFKSSADAYIHLGYESVTLSSDTARVLGIKTEGKQTQMSGRSGLYVNADSVFEMLIEKSATETKRRNPDLNEKQILEIAKIVSVGTLRYEMIKQDLDKIINFDLVKSLSLEGDTAPYIQYTHARASRIIEKSVMTPNMDAHYELLNNEYEKNLIKHIGLFENAVGDSARNLSPKVIARYCHDLAVIFNSFYEHVKVLDSEDSELVNARMCLVLSCKTTLKNALSMLGIDAPSRM